MSLVDDGPPKSGKIHFAKHLALLKVFKISYKKKFLIPNRYPIIPGIKVYKTFKSYKP